MFSIMTIASSTTNPVAMVSAMSDRLLRLYPSAYMKPKVPTSESGTAMLGMSVARTLRRKTKMTATTRPMVMTSVRSTSSTEARTVSVRSLTTLTSMPRGSDACSCGRSAFTRSATWMTLAPGWRCTLRMMARSSFCQPASCEFSTPSTTWATSVRRTGEPFA
jgi:hypothetical protein